MVPKICTFEGCDRVQARRELCNAHNHQRRRGVALTPTIDKRPPNTCSVSECEREYYGKGFCQPHHKQWWKGQQVGPIKKRNPLTWSTEQRFWSYVTKTDTCWEWTGTKIPAGYGNLTVEGKHKLPHRLSYEWAHGEIPAGMQVDHRCHNRLCVNPDHLRLATPMQNQENHSGPQRNNTSGIRGVNWDKRAGKWRAVVHHAGTRHFVGYFSATQEAGDAVIAKRLELHTHNDLDRINN